jgi:hypothetical protein
MAALRNLTEAEEAEQEIELARRDLRHYQGLLGHREAGIAQKAAWSVAGLERWLTNATRHSNADPGTALDGLRAGVGTGGR